MSQVVRSNRDIPYHPHIMNELSRNLYTNPITALKELIYNAWDADSLEFRLTLDKNKVIAEDWGVGMTVNELDKFWVVGSPHKTSLKFTHRYNRPVIGSKGLGGKGGLRKLGDRPCITTRKEVVPSRPSDQIQISIPEYREEDGIIVKATYGTVVHPVRGNEFLMPHGGTKFEITGLRTELDPKEVIGNFQRTLYAMTNSIVSEHPMKIIVNDQPVVAAPPSDAKARDIRMFCMDAEKITGREINYGEIRGLVWPSKTPSIDVIVKAPVITTSSVISPMHPVAGYVIADFLNVDTERTGLITDEPTYKAFIRQLSTYVSSHFPSQADFMAKKQEKSMKTLARLMDTILMEDNFNPESLARKFDNEIPGVYTQTEGGTTVENKPIEPTIEKSSRENPIPKTIESAIASGGTGRPVKSKFGFIYQPRQYGANNPSIIISYGNPTIVGFNTDTDLVGTCMAAEGRSQLIAMSQLYAGAYGLMKDKLQFISEVRDIDTYTRFIEGKQAQMLSKLMEKTKE